MLFGRIALHNFSHLLQYFRRLLSSNDWDDLGCCLRLGRWLNRAQLKGRTGKDRAFGGQLDVLIDIVSYGVAPAVLLLSYGKFEPVFLIGAFLMLAASAMRLSYFSTYGLDGGTSYTGLALDNNNIILVFIFLSESIFHEELFSVVLYASCMGLAALNVSQIKTPKLSGNPINVYMLAVYTFSMTAFYGSNFL
jgi:CDP-diacylglycerol--serine O-phosphatidyltransferase